MLLNLPSGPGSVETAVSGQHGTPGPEHPSPDDFLGGKWAPLPLGFFTRPPGLSHSVATGLQERVFQDTGNRGCPSVGSGSGKGHGVTSALRIGQSNHRARGWGQRPSCLTGGQRTCRLPRASALHRLCPRGSLLASPSGLQVLYFWEVSSAPVPSPRVTASHSNASPCLQAAPRPPPLAPCMPVAVSYAALLRNQAWLPTSR